MSIVKRKGDLDDVSPLEGLPCELTWKIIEFVPEAVFNLRQTSRLIHARVDTFALENNDIQLVKQLTIRGMVCYKGKFNKLMHDENMISLMARAMRGGVGRVIQSYWTDEVMLGVIANLLGSIEFRKLKLTASTLTKDTSSYILNLLNANSNIDHLSLYVWGVNCADPINFLLDLSSRVRSLKVRQCIQDADKRRHYFFGMDNIEWAPVILEMFSRKMEKLHIDNHLYPRYLSSASADALRKRLPQIGKKIWFEGTCNVYPIAMNYTENEHSVHVDSSDSEDASNLRIKHASRVDELFKDNYPIGIPYSRS